MPEFFRPTVELTRRREFIQAAPHHLKLQNTLPPLRSNELLGRCRDS
jgi:hypothetical protein